MTIDLGKWALIDIETTGIDSIYDEIIDIGYLQFDGIKLEKKFSSLVRSEKKISGFIQKLTGITQKMNDKAPLWKSVEKELLDLESHKLVAHNADFERKFLQKSFDSIASEHDESFEDSILYFALLHPGRSSLNLEGLLIDYKIAEKELHRGYEDSLDLLKVILISTFIAKKNMVFFQIVCEAVTNFLNLEEFWLGKFLFLSNEELKEIASQIDFDLDLYAAKYLEAQSEVEDSKNDYLNWKKLNFSSEVIKEIFESEEKIQTISPNYHYRSSQLELANRVGQAFKNGIHALIQAPTGTGKTLGYLVPSVLFSRETNEKVLISTGTKALQHQAFSKDIPQLRKILGLGEDELKITGLLGSNNHLCELLFRNQLLEDEGMLGGLGSFDEKYSKAYLEIIFQVNAIRDYDQKLTRLDIPYILKMLNSQFKDFENQVAVDYRSCSGHKCPYAPTCSYIQGLKQANDSQIILGNHALMLTWPKGLPKPMYVVVDEAHRLEKEATTMFSTGVSQKQLEIFFKSLDSFQGIGALLFLMSFDSHSQEKSALIRKEVQSKKEMLKEHQDELPFLIETLFKKMPRYSDNYWNERFFPKKTDLKDPVMASIYNHLDSLKFIYESLYVYLLNFQNLYAGKDQDNPQKVIASTRFETFMSSLEDIYVGLKNLMEGSEIYTHTLKYLEAEGFAALSAPVDVGREIYSNVLNESTSTIFTSATLANADGTAGVNGVEWMTGYLYLDAKKRFKTGLYLNPTFDYAKKTSIHICSDVPALYYEEFVVKMLDKIMPLVIDLGGRSLLLFSSKVRFEIAREILLKEYDGKLSVFVQGMGNNVVDEFKKSSNGILIGMETFGEGIDVPGEKLQFLFVDKIPDIRMDLVIEDRRKFFDSRFGNEFNEYYLANRTRSLHQKLGRLLRTNSDIGAAIIVDSRMAKWKSGTLRTFKQMMQPYDVNFTKIDDACSEVLNFLKKSE